MIPDSTREPLIGYLRQEAYAVRDCFTTYSVQTTIAVGGALIAIAKFQVEVPYVGLMSIFPILLVFHVAGMGIHKYGTSNRLLAYELHLQRTSHDIDIDPCHQMMKIVGWEEAMRAWRVVEPNIWRTIYWPIGRIRRKFRRITIWPGNMEKIAKSSSKFWFDQIKSFDEHGVNYSAGGYLETISTIFASAILACLTLSYIAVSQLWFYLFYSLPEGMTGLLPPDYMVSVPERMKGLLPSDYRVFLSINIIVTASLFVVTTLSIARWRNIKSRITVLETGLSSIHSGGILWEAIILAHLRALQDRGFFDITNDSGLSMHGYTRNIAKYAQEIADQCFDIHRWIEESRKTLKQDIKLYLQRRRSSSTPA